jgi:hypothetical protein
VRLDPKTVILTFQSNPAGLQLVMGSNGGAAPFNRTVIIGSVNSISAPTPQTLNGTDYRCAAWSDGGAQSYNITAPATPTTYTATFQTTCDTVAIQRAEYSGTAKQLRVQASSTRSTATLSVYVTASGQRIGTLANKGGGTYSGNFKWSVDPQNITVRSSLGGVASAPITRIK